MAEPAEGRASISVEDAAAPHSNRPLLTKLNSGQRAFARAVPEFRSAVILRRSRGMAYEEVG